MRYIQLVVTFFVALCVLLSTFGCGVRRSSSTARPPLDGSGDGTCSITDVADGYIIQCGQTSAFVRDGADGADGQDGADGADGQDGADGADGQDGADGADGQDGADGADAILEIIDPCGDGPGFDEVILRLNDGSLLAYFEQGSKRHLSILTPGNYRTTDQQKCNFTVTQDLEITY